MNLELTRKIAVLQATAESLRAASRSFTETADMLTHQRFQDDFAEYLAAHQEREDVPADPAGFVLSETARLEILIAPIEEFISEQLKLGQEVLAPEKHSLTKELVAGGLASATEALATLVEAQHRLSSGFLNKDLTMEKGGIDVAPDLLAFCRLRLPGSPLLRPDRAELCQFANGEGPLHAKVVMHLELVLTTCSDLVAQHSAQAAILEQAQALAETADYSRAAALLAGMNQVFSDLPYGRVTKKVEEWKLALTEIETKFSRLRKEVEAAWRTPFGQPWQVNRHREEMKQRLQHFQDVMVQFHADLEGRRNSDYAREGHLLFKRITGSFEAVTAGLARACSASRARANTELAGLLLGALVSMRYYQQLWPLLVVVVGGVCLVKLTRATHRALAARTRVDFQLKANGNLIEDREKAFVYLNGQLVRSGDPIAPGTYQLTLDTSLYEPLSRTVEVQFGRHNGLGAIAVKLNRETHTNTLGMRFVPVPGTTVMFSIWPARVQDFEGFIRDSGTKWLKPKFRQDGTHPVVSVSWDDARAFCSWLTEKEQRERKLGERDTYRLPTDLEWSAAVELGKEVGATPAERDGRITGVYPWGTHWPPPRRAGNYDPELHQGGFDYTSPVGSFEANRIGLFDLGGNVWEWCQDYYDETQQHRVLRGASWRSSRQNTLLSSARLFDSPGHRVDIVGFRCVLEARRPSPVFSTREKPGEAEKPAASASAPAASAA